MKIRRSVLLCALAAVMVVFSGASVQADIGIGQPPPPSQLPGGGGNGGGGSSSNFEVREINGVLVGGTRTSGGGFNPIYIPYPPAYGNYRWPTSAEGVQYRNCSLYYEVWRFTGPISNPTKLTTVSHAIQPNVCDAGKTVPALFSSVHPHDRGAPPTMGQISVPAQAAKTGVGSPWEAGVFLSLENVRWGQSSPAGTAAPNSVGPTPPFRIVYGRSCTDFQSNVHESQLRNTDNSVWLGTTATRASYQKTRGAGFSAAWAYRVNNVPVNGNFARTDAQSCTSVLDYMLEQRKEADKSNERIVAGVCFAEVRAKMLQFHEFPAAGPWYGSTGEHAWGFNALDANRQFYYNVSTSRGARTNYDRRQLTNSQVNTIWGRYENAVRADLNSRTYTPTPIASVLGTPRATWFERVPNGMDCMLGSAVGGNPDTPPPCESDPTRCPPPLGTCRFGTPNCPQISVGGSVTVRLDAFQAGQVGGAFTDNEYLISTSTSRPSGHYACGTTPPNNVAQARNNVAQIVGPCVTNVRVNGFKLVAPSGMPASSFKHVKAYNGQNLVSGSFRGNVRFTEPTKDGREFRWSWTSATATAYWTVYGWNEVTGPCPADPAVTCHLGWQRVSMRVNRTINADVQVRPSQTFPVIGATVRPG